MCSASYSVVGLFFKLYYLSITMYSTNATHLPSGSTSQGARDGILLVDGVWVARSITSGVASGGR
jgi:hypothetical protein